MPARRSAILAVARVRRASPFAHCAMLAALCASSVVLAQAPAPTGPAVPAATTPAPATAPAAPATPIVPPAPPATGATPKQPPAASTPPPAAAADPLAALAWLHGCWAGNVNLRAFTEQWTAPAAGMMLGLGHTVMNGKTLSYEFMRIETRADGKIAYVAKPTDKVEEGFVYEGTRDDRGMTGYVFSNPARDFPSQIIYQRSPRGELFAYVKGKINGADREVIYPFHAVDCASGKAL